MIRSFADRSTERFYHGERVRQFDGIRDQAQRKLTFLDAAASLEAIGSIPGNRLETLRGARQGQYSIRINAQWRICFRWTNEGPENVEIVDYH